MNDPFSSRNTRILHRIEEKIDKLIPEVKDVSKHLAEAKELANKGKPPRKQPNKMDKDILKEFIECNTS